MSLAELSLQAESCVACELSLRRRNVVFGQGDPASPLVIVGEGPGDQEDRTGVPFVGRAGELLDEALAANGIARSHVYICNIVKCRAASWIDGKPRNRPPQPAEIAACRRWLVPQLSALAPRMILCLGATSAKALIKPDFALDNLKAWNRAAAIAWEVVLEANKPQQDRREVVPGADHFLVSTLENPPLWAQGEPLARIGDHSFYKVKRL